VTDATGRPTALPFPGQGSQVDGLRERADESTRFAPPALFCASIAAYATLELDVPIVAAAGHSLGEPAALTVAAVFEPAHALRAELAHAR
jgi:malonyl CoA-acyl carrier protein transacylase